MLEIMQPGQVAPFLNRVKIIRKERQDWNIMEVAIEEEWTDRLSSEDVSARLREAFRDKDGIGIICNVREVLCLIKWGQERGITELCARVENNLPEKSCAIEGSDVTPEGIERVQVKLSGAAQMKKQIPQIRAAHTKEVILIASADSEFKTGAVSVFQEYGQIIMAADFKKMVQLYIDKAPEMLVWDIETIRKNGEVPLKTILDMDDEASIICVSSTIDTSFIVEAKKLGIENIISKPIDEQTASKLVGNSHHFSWKT